MKRIRTCGVVGGGAGARFTRFFGERRTKDLASPYRLSSRTSTLTKAEEEGGRERGPW